MFCCLGYRAASTTAPATSMCRVRKACTTAVIVAPVVTTSSMTMTDVDEPMVRDALRRAANAFATLRRRSEADNPTESA